MDFRPSMKRAKLVVPGPGEVDGLDAGGVGGVAQGHVDKDARGNHIPMINMQTVSKWRGRPRIVRRDHLSQTSMFNFTVKN